MTWLLALTGPALLAVAAAGLADLVRREDLTWPQRGLWILAALAAPPFAALLYVLTRPTGVDRSLLGEPGGERAGTHGPREHLVHRAGRLAAHGLFRSVEVLAPPDLPRTGPQLWVASHFGALSDPIVLLHALPRPPRFLAADALFRFPVVREVLRFAGAIPVRRSQDGGGDANTMAFAAAWRTLRAGGHVAIFPEGIANDTSQLAPLRTGAARIALGAAAPGLVLVPVGIHYQDKAGLRRRVFVDVGRPLDLDAWCAARPVPPGDPAEDLAADRALVRALTDELEARLRVAAPSFVDAEEQHALLTAAGIALRGPEGSASYGARADLADALAEQPAEVKSQLVDAVSAYRDELDAAGLDDGSVVRHDRRSLRGLAVTLVLGGLLLPPAAVGAVVHAPLAAVTWASGFLRVAPVTAATIRPAVGVVGALTTWSVVTWWAVRAELVEGVTAVLAFASVVLPLWGLAALVVGERLLLITAALRRRARFVARPGRRDATSADLLAPLRRDRQRLVALVDAARGGAASHG